MSYKRIVFEAPPELYKEFKLEVVRNNQSIKDAMIELMEYYVENKMIIKDEK